MSFTAGTDVTLSYLSWSANVNGQVQKATFECTVLWGNPLGKPTESPPTAVGEEPVLLANSVTIRLPFEGGILLPLEFQAGAPPDASLSLFYPSILGVPPQRVFNFELRSYQTVSGRSRQSLPMTAENSGARVRLSAVRDQAWSATESLCFKLVCSCETALTSLPGEVDLSQHLGKDCIAEPDIDIVSEGETPVGAHSSMLKRVPYFAATLQQPWAESCSGKRQIKLPFNAGKRVLEVFLEHVYGQPEAMSSLALDDTAMQELFELGDACDETLICANIAQLVQIDESNVARWIRWLGKERSRCAIKIRKKAARALHKCMTDKDMDNMPIKLLEELLKIKEL